MIANLRAKLKSKKGFTLVELIVVIVIILILAAVMVPSLTKYIGKANMANTKSNASAVLSQLQADAAGKAALGTDDEDIKLPEGDTDYMGTRCIGLSSNAVSGSNQSGFTYMEEDGQVTAFSFGDGKYYLTWNKDAGWTGPDKSK